VPPNGMFSVSIRPNDLGKQHARLR